MLKLLVGNYQTIKNKIKEYEINISHFTGQAWNQGKRYRQINKPKPLEEILKKDSSYQSYKLKERLLANGLKEHKCECCNNTEWLGKPIKLELHHINGDHNDNRLENLQVLCPNCHSYTDTYRASNKNRYEVKNEVKYIELTEEEYIEHQNKQKSKSIFEKIEKPKRYCEVCGKELTNKQTKFCSYECSTKAQTKRPNENVLRKIMEENNYNQTKVGKLFNVSPNAVKKWCKHYNIQYKKN